MLFPHKGSDSMEVTLDYGRTGLKVQLPDRNVVKTLRYKQAPPLEDRRLPNWPRGGKTPAWSSAT